MASAITGPAGEIVPEAEPVRSGQAAVVTAGLAKSYGSTVALAGLDLHIAPGRTAALVGPNGAGKSTTTGLVARTPRSGAAGRPGTIAWG